MEAVEAIESILTALEESLKVSQLLRERIEAIEKKLNELTKTVENKANPIMLIGMN